MRSNSSSRRENGTEVSVKWPYAEEIPQPKGEKYLAMHEKVEMERKQKTKRLIKKFKPRIGAADIPTADDKKGGTS